MPYIGKQPASVPVTADDIPNNSITAAKIVDAAITIDDIGPNAVGSSEMADDAVGLNELSASGTTNSSTFLRGDNTWAAPPATDISGKLSLSGGTMTGAIDFGDNVKANFGTSDDLQIYHSGADSYIVDSGDGDLYIRASNEIRIQDGNEANFLYAVEDGDIRLYYGGSEKLATTNTGVNVTGEATSSNGTYGTKLTYSGGNQSGIIDTYGNHDLEFRANNDRAMTIASNGDISFYEDTGTTAKFFWDASDERLSLTGSDYQFKIGQGVNQPWYLRGKSDGDFALHLNATGDVLVADTSGNVGIAVTPESGWSTKVMQLGRTSIGTGNDATGGQMNWNAYYDGNWKYKDPLEATQYTMNNAHTFQVAATGSANGAITWITGFEVLTAVNEGKARAKNGLLFGTDTATANTLDDYEEGTWTPAFTGTGGASGQTYSDQSGLYTKIGNKCFCSCNIALTALGTISGFVKISGFPFNFASAGTATNAGAHAYAHKWDLDSGHVLESWVYNTNTLYLMQTEYNGDAPTQLTSSHMQNTTGVKITFSYTTE